jgi:hypothetical protein
MQLIVRWGFCSSLHQHTKYCSAACMQVTKLGRFSGFCHLPYCHCCCDRLNSAGQCLLARPSSHNFTRQPERRACSSAVCSSSAQRQPARTLPSCQQQRRPSRLLRRLRECCWPAAGRLWHTAVHIVCGADLPVLWGRSCFRGRVFERWRQVRVGQSACAEFGCEPRPLVAVPVGSAGRWQADWEAVQRNDDTTWQCRCGKLGCCLCFEVVYSQRASQPPQQPCLVAYLCSGTQRWTALTHTL